MYFFRRCLPFVASIACFLYATAVDAGPHDGRLDIYWIDVEGGAATLMITPAGESVLIDTGERGIRDPDRIARVVTRVAGLRQIDHLIVTHYHSDHYGGAATLSKIIHIGKVYDNGLFEDMPEAPPEKSYFNFRCDERIVINPGDQLALRQVDKPGVAPISLTCLGTRKEFVAAPEDKQENQEACAGHIPKERDGSDNANSIVMLARFGPFDFFDAGHLTWNQEHRLMCPKNPVGTVDVYQVTHHGLDSSNNPVVLQSLQPTVAVMNNGVTKGCMPEVFANLKGTESIEAIYQVHKNLRPDGTVNNAADEYIANHQKMCKGHYIKLSVAPGGATYSVEIPANEHRREYRTK